MEFKEPEVFEVEVLDDDGGTFGMLKKMPDGFIFRPASEYDQFTAYDLRAIADELDRRNGQ